MPYAQLIISTCLFRLYAVSVTLAQHARAKGVLLTLHEFARTPGGKVAFVIRLFSADIIQRARGTVLGAFRPAARTLALSTAPCWRAFKWPNACVNDVYK